MPTAQDILTAGELHKCRDAAFARYQQAQEMIAKLQHHQVDCRDNVFLSLQLLESVERSLMLAIAVDLFSCHREIPERSPTKADIIAHHPVQLFPIVRTKNLNRSPAREIAER